LQIFARQNVKDADRAHLICVIKLHHISTSWQRSCGAAFFGLEDYSAKKINKSQEQNMACPRAAIMSLRKIAR